MVTTAGVVFVIAAVALFFFWIYGIVSFYFDLRYRFVPVVREYRREDEQYDRSVPDELR
ncbi:hypothetical protein [Natrialba asiatica]|uniref:Uncharacterized protein n=1 Tax=Natrialba asiatica (strain ATCC 700177 / DSM 12278 / JCM 9576 / FERM P-10747 / NBRC 102637 / 172P1) TaxID=29540 RepID=M0B5H2_NATA1|nr:hypothetical protein [Natrialba asiatica]ELZ06161.1 hypothetical protein C481_01475 [Natrialba asiatica DSM 12278]